MPLPPKQSININCNRSETDVTRDGQNISVLPSGAITINTKLKNYQISLPEQSVIRLTDKQADEIQQKLSSFTSNMAAQFKALKANPSRSTLGYTSHRGGGANAMAMASSCPAGQVMVGIEMIIGGTCRTQCDAEGGAFHKYRIICSPRFK